MKTLSAFVLAGLFAILVAGCGAKAGPTKTTTDTNFKRIHGAEGAKVQIVCYYPFNEKHLKIIAWLNSLADKHPGQVHVTAWDFSTHEGGAAAKEAWGKICGGIKINGQSEFKDIMVDDKKQDVSSEGGEWISWTRPEIEAVVAQAVKEAYPGAK